MLFTIIKQLNWVDLFVVFLLLRILYVSAKNGFVAELFKLIGIIFTIYLSLHYYSKLSNLISKRMSLEQSRLEYVDFFIFISLVAATYLIFAFLRKIFLNFVKIEAVAILSKWGGLILGFFRGALSGGLVIIILSIATLPYLNTSARKSYFGERLFNITVFAYSALWNGVMSKFMVNEKFNQAIFKVQSFASSQK